MIIFSLVGLTLIHASTRAHANYALRIYPQGPLLLTWINFNPSVDK